MKLIHFAKHGRKPVRTSELPPTLAGTFNRNDAVEAAVAFTRGFNVPIGDRIKITDGLALVWTFRVATVCSTKGVLEIL